MQKLAITLDLIKNKKTPPSAGQHSIRFKERSRRDFNGSSNTTIGYFITHHL